MPTLSDDFTIGRLALKGDPLEEAPLKVVDTVVELQRTNSWSLSSVYIQALRRQHGGGIRATVCSCFQHVFIDVFCFDDADGSLIEWLHAFALG